MGRGAAVVRDPDPVVPRGAHGLEGPVPTCGRYVALFVRPVPCLLTALGLRAIAPPAGLGEWDVRMSDTIPDRLEDLVDELLPWASTMPSITFYLYGSRGRGDHRPDSDVDLHFDTENASWDDLLTFYDGDGPPEKYGNLRDQSKEWAELRADIRAARQVYRRRNFVCVYLPDARKLASSN